MPEQRGHAVPVQEAHQGRRWVHSDKSAKVGQQYGTVAEVVSAVSLGGKGE